MKERAFRLFNMYKGEEKQVLFFFFLAFVLFFAVFLSYKLSDALFIVHLSTSKLPIAYGAISTTLIFSALLLIRAYNRHTTFSVFVKLLSLAIIVYGALAILSFLHILEMSEINWLYLKIITQTVYVQILSCFWTFVDQYYHFQDAKRLYTIFNSAVYLGFTAAGCVISLSLFPVHITFAIACILVLIALGMVVRYSSSFETVPDDTEVQCKVHSETKAIHSFFSSLFQSKFSLFLMSANLVTFLLLTTTEISYLSAFQSTFSTNNTIDSGALTRFYGLLLAIAGLCNLVIGWFFYSRAVLRFGITTLVFITPISFFLVYTGWHFDFGLLSPICALFLCETFLPVIDDNNFNLLLNAVPLKLKPKIRILIESFSEPTGMLLSSIFIYFGIINPHVLGIFLGIIAIFIAANLYNNYFNAIFQNLKNHALHLYKTTKDWLQALPKKERKLAEEKLIHMAVYGDESLQKNALEVLFSWEKTSLIKRLFAEEKKLSPQAKIHLLFLIDKTNAQLEPILLETICRWQEEANTITLQGEIDFFLAKRGLLHPDKVYPNLESLNLRQKCAAILALQNSFASQNIHDLAYNRTAAVETLQQLIESQDEEELIAGIEILGFEGTQQNIEVLINYLHHPSLRIAKAAAQALYESVDIADVRHGKTLIYAIRRRNDTEFRILCLKTIAKIGSTSLLRPLITLTAYLRPVEMRILERIASDLGLKTVPTLVSMVKDTQLPDRPRLIAGKILAQLSLPQLKANLYEVIETELERAYFYFYYAHTLPQEYEGNDLSLLKDGLLSSFQSVIDFIIQLLGASKWIEDAELIAFSLRSKNPKIISQALETLELCCERKIFRLLYPLISDVPLKEKLRLSTSYTDIHSGVLEVLLRLEGMSNTLDLILAITWMYRLDVPIWRSMLRKHIAKKEEIFHHFTYELLET